MDCLTLSATFLGTKSFSGKNGVRYNLACFFCNDLGYFEYFINDSISNSIFSLEPMQFVTVDFVPRLSNRELKLMLEKVY